MDTYPKTYFNCPSAFELAQLIGVDPTTAHHIDINQLLTSLETTQNQRREVFVQCVTSLIASWPGSPDHHLDDTLIASEPVTY